MCKVPHPDLEKLTFTDDCGAIFDVDPVESPPEGSVCDGRVVERVWMGPTDECGNSAENYTQTITIKDQAPPVFPAAIPDLSFTCPQDFDLAEVDEPIATDDCSMNVTVSGEVSLPEKCKPRTIIWTATDDCEKVTTANQKVLFTDTAPPALVGQTPSDKMVGCGKNIEITF